MDFISQDTVGFANGYARKMKYLRNWLAEAEELASEGLLRLVKAVSTGSFIPVSEGEVKRYLARCISTAATDDMRRNKAAKRNDGVLPVSMALFEGEDNENSFSGFQDNSAAVVSLRIEIDEAIASLEGRQRRIVELQSYGYTTEEIAEQLQSEGFKASLGTVSRERSAAVDRLRSLLVE